jgi:hypothetical protein
MVGNSKREKENNKGGKLSPPGPANISSKKNRQSKHTAILIETLRPFSKNTSCPLGGIFFLQGIECWVPLRFPNIPSTQIFA